MRRNKRQSRFMVLVKARPPREDYGEGVHSVRGNRVWLSHAGEAGLRHTAQLDSRIHIGGASVKPYFAAWLAPAFKRDAETTHKLVGHQQLEDGRWANTVEADGDPSYHFFPSRSLAHEHAMFMSDNTRKSHLFNGLSRAFEKANSDGKGVIVLHPHRYQNLMAMRDLLRHEDTHSVLDQTIPDWEDSLFGEGHHAAKFLEDADIRRSIERLIPAYGDHNPRLLLNEMIARIGNRDGLRDLGLDTDHERYVRVLAKVLDKGVEHHGDDFYKLFMRSAPVLKGNAWRHAAGNQFDPRYGSAVAAVEGRKIYLSHDGAIGNHHLGGLGGADGYLPPHHIENALARVKRERDGTLYSPNLHPTKFSAGGNWHYSLSPMNNGKQGRAVPYAALSEQAAKRHVQLVGSPLKQELFGGLHQAISDAAAISGNKGIQIVEPIGRPAWERNEEMEKAFHSDKREDGIALYHLHPDWNAKVARRFAMLLESHKRGGYEGMRRAWRQILEKKDEQ